MTAKTAVWILQRKASPRSTMTEQFQSRIAAVASRPDCAVTHTALHGLVEISKMVVLGAAVAGSKYSTQA